MIFDRFGKCGFANSIKDAAVLRKAGYKMQESATLRNMPVVPDKSRARALKGRKRGATTRLVPRPSSEIF